MPESYIPSNLLYATNPSSISGTGNYVKFSPIAGSSFGNDESFKINIQSTNAFLDPTRSYLKFKVSWAGTKSNTHKLPKTGYAYLIKDVVTSVGGVEIERFNNAYNKYVSKLYSTFTTEYQNILTKLECYNAQTSGGVELGRSDVSVVHNVRTSLLEQGKAIPLCFIRGGISMEFFLDTMNKFLNVNIDAGLTSFTVSDVEFVAYLITPPESYLSSFAKNLESGNVAKIPLEITKCVQNTPQNQSENVYTIQSGFHKSLSEIMMLTHSSTLGVSSATSGNDSSYNFGLNGATSYRLDISGKRFPSNKELYCTNISTATCHPEQLIMQLNARDNSYPFYNVTTNTFDTCANSLYYNFRSNPIDATSGVPLSDGMLTLTVNGTPSSTSVYNYVFMTIAGVLKIGADSVSLDTKNLD